MGRWDGGIFTAVGRGLKLRKKAIILGGGKVMNGVHPGQERGSEKVGVNLEEGKRKGGTSRAPLL